MFVLFRVIFRFHPLVFGSVVETVVVFSAHNVWFFTRRGKVYISSRYWDSFGEKRYGQTPAFQEEHDVFFLQDGGPAIFLCWEPFREKPILFCSVIWQHFAPCLEPCEQCNLFLFVVGRLQVWKIVCFKWWGNFQDLDNLKCVTIDHCLVFHCLFKIVGFSNARSPTGRKNRKKSIFGILKIELKRNEIKDRTRLVPFPVTTGTTCLGPGIPN